MRGSWMGFLTLTVGLAGTLAISCGHKPAYSDIQPKDPQANRASEQPTNSSDQPAPPAAEAEQPASPPAALVPEAAGNRPPVARVPDFIDQGTGEFKDLPSFPMAYRTNAQIGPIDGAETAMFLFETTESFQSIAAFYDKAIKKNGWTIVGHIRDPEHLKWELARGKTSEGLVEVKGEFNSKRKGIILSRVEKQQASSPSRQKSP